MEWPKSDDRWAIATKVKTYWYISFYMCSRYLYWCLVTMHKASAPNEQGQSGTSFEQMLSAG